MRDTKLEGEISRRIWDERYRYRQGTEVFDLRIEDTWHRIAHALAAVEINNKEEWASKFFDLLNGFKFLPGGRIQAGAGTRRRVTLFNCFVMGVIEDSIDGIFESLKEGALTMRQGGGVGYDFSTIRPRASTAKATGRRASGPVSFMQIWETMCATLCAAGNRRGAMMATLRCDHPDIEAFITAKASEGALSHFNLSVLVTDEFMHAVRADKPWQLVFPRRTTDHSKRTKFGTVWRRLPGSDAPAACDVHEIVQAPVLWEKIMRANYDYAEPGVLFIDRINEQNNLSYEERISATNPCGEVPLPPYGACDLGAINLTQFVRGAFTSDAWIDMKALEHSAAIATRFLDNVIDVSHFPLVRQARQAQRCRRIGLGVTGLGDALIMLGFSYDTQQAREFGANLMRTICHAAYRASTLLAEEKGAFPAFESAPYLEGAFIRTLPRDIQSAIKKHGIRNSHLTAIAPAGTISLLADNVSSGIEPMFDLVYQRRFVTANGEASFCQVEDYAYRQWQKGSTASQELPEQFVSAREIDPTNHIKMQSALQPYVDNAISKTINVAEDYPFEQFKDLYMMAFDLGLKGCTSYRHHSRAPAVLSNGK